MIGKLLPQPLKRALKSSFRFLRREQVRLTDGYDLTTLEARMRDVGLTEGDIVIVHVGMKHLKGINGKPDDVIDLLLKIIGPTGTLLMPSLPFQTTAWHYTTSGEITDLRSTPSLMGLVTELFRLRPGVLRSSHPTHPILALGPAAEEMLADHAKCRTPCGEHSPFHKLHEMGGKMMLLGTGIYTNTFYHYLEEVFEDSLPKGVITPKTYDISYIDMSGRQCSITNRVFDPHFSRIRDVGLYEQQLREDGYWQEAFVGRLQVVHLTASQCHESMRRMIERGEHCYVRDLPPDENYPQVKLDGIAQ